MPHILLYLHDPEDQVNCPVSDPGYVEDDIFIRRSLSNKDSLCVIFFTLFGCFMVAYVILLGGGYMSGLWLQGQIGQQQDKNDGITIIKKISYLYMNVSNV